MQSCAYLSSATIIRTEKEIDIEAEDIRLIIYIHQKDREHLLWPALRQIPSESNMDGLLGDWLE